MNDPESSQRTSPLVDFLAAAQFLTIAPPLVTRPFTAKEMGRSTGYYPLVGLLLGCVLYGLAFALEYVFQQTLVNALVLAAWVALTGALHLDGFLDTCDGLLGGYTPESRLEIMHDERVGAFAMAGGILLFLVKFTALAAIVDQNGIEGLGAALLLAPTLGRWAITFALIIFPYAREKGLGRDIKDQAGPFQLALASLIAALVAWFTVGWIGILSLGTAAFVTLLFVRYTLNRVPGLTGDIYGAVDELAEAATLLVLAVQIHF